MCQGIVTPVSPMPYIVMPALTDFTINGEVYHLDEEGNLVKGRVTREDDVGGT